MELPSQSQSQSFAIRTYKFKKLWLINSLCFRNRIQDEWSACMHSISYISNSVGLYQFKVGLISLGYVRKWKYVHAVWSFNSKLNVLRLKSGCLKRRLGESSALQMSPRNGLRRRVKIVSSVPPSLRPRWKPLSFSPSWHRKGTSILTFTKNSTRTSFCLS